MDPKLTGRDIRQVSLCETHVLRSPQRNPGDTRNMLQAQLRNRLPGLLLVARVYLHRGSGGDSRLGITARSLDFRVGAALGLLNLGALLGGWVVWQFFNAGVRHVDLRTTPLKHCQLT